MILSGSAVQTKGFGSWLASAMKRLMAVWSSTTERKTPRLRRRLVSLAKKPSTALSQEQDVGVKWKTTRGWRVSQALTFGCDPTCRTCSYLSRTQAGVRIMKTEIVDACFALPHWLYPSLRRRDKATFGVSPDLGRVCGRECWSGR